MDPNPSSQVIGSIPGPSSLTTFRNLIKRQVKLSDKSMVALDQFIQLRSTEEHDLFLFAHVLELLDITRKIERVDQWVISPTLSRKITTYSQVFMLSPQLSAYRGLKLPEHLLSGMRESNVAELPPDSDPVKVDLVVSKIGRQTTQAQNVTKSAVKTSLEPGSELENIAELAHKLISGTKIKATVQLYIRLAFIRFVMASYPGLTDDAFWLQVDECLDKNSKQCETQAELDQ
ncbi:hypothetical protein MVEN_00437900 [Mycena venus]|uniref:Uncharacterized protein n=1 Tax=Mycena venus TaxID=2733690 RepID=A0A8H6YR00_9AGAR|nr:hypothetical protein MVEN_00437900 [Mycena venus]